MKYSTILSIALALAVALVPATAQAKKKKDKDRQQVTLADDRNTPKTVQVKNAAKQLYGEWNVLELNKKAVYTPERAYLYLDFAGGNRLMGCLGCNAVNGRFTLKGDKMSFSDLITTNKGCSAEAAERSLLKALHDAHSFTLTRLDNTEFLTINDKHNNPLIKLRRQNIDFLNGGWLVKELNGDNVEKRNIKLVADVEMLTVNANSGCNIINGVITINPNKEFAVEFEDLVSSHNQCPNLSTETRMLIALEETAYCKKLNDHETELLDRDGKTIVVLKRISVSQLKR